MARICSKLEKIPTVDIDPSGTFNYILVRAFCCGADALCIQRCKTLLRGYARDWHTDIYSEINEQVLPWGIRLEVLGGGKIQHDPQIKKIKVFGKSDGYGKADHGVSVGLLREIYEDYEIVCDDDKLNE